MFNLHNFVFKALETMRFNVNEYQVRVYALTWYNKAVLTDEDMSIIDSWYNTVDEVTEEQTENEVEEGE